MNRNETKLDNIVVEIKGKWSECSPSSLNPGLESILNLPSSNISHNKL